MSANVGAGEHDNRFKDCRGCFNENTPECRFRRRYAADGDKTYIDMVENCGIYRSRVLYRAARAAVGR